MSIPRDDASTLLPPARIRQARNGVFLVFALNGLIFASWASRYPDVTQMLHLSPSQLGILILATSVGAIVGLPAAGWILGRIGTVHTIRRGLAVSLPGYACAAVTVSVGGPLPVAAAGLFLAGLGTGVWDVSQNLEGTTVERALGRSIMPWFHAAFSGGTVLGALIGALIVWLRVPILPHLLVTIVVTAVGVAAATRSFLSAPAGPVRLPERGEGTTPRGKSAWTEPRTILIGVMVLAAAFAEGTANDWLSVAFVSGHGVQNSVGVVATAVFLTFMTVGRILGTRVLDRFGRTVVLSVLFVCAIAGNLLVVFGTPTIAFIGVAVWGIGASLGFPVGMSAAADDPARASARISVVSTIGYIAFLGGPTILGVLGDHVGILHALLAVGVASALALVVVPSARQPAAQGD